MLVSFKAALNGLRTTWLEERNFRIEICIGILVVGSFFFVSFSALERILLTASVFAVLTAELVNTAIEDLGDKVEPNFDPVIGKVKDIMAAYVLMSCIGALSVGISVFITHFLLV